MRLCVSVGAQLPDVVGDLMPLEHGVGEPVVEYECERHALAVAVRHGEPLAVDIALRLGQRFADAVALPDEHRVGQPLADADALPDELCVG